MPRGDFAFSVRPFTNPQTGSASFRVEGRSHGKRTRRNFADPAEAEKFCEDQNLLVSDEAVVNRGTLVRTTLKPEDLRSAEVAANNGPLSEIIDAGLEVWRRRSKPQPIEKLAIDWLAIVKQEVSHRWYLDLNARVRRFVRDHKDATTATIDRVVARKWLDGMKLTPTTRRNYRNALHRWAEWLREAGHVTVNPFADQTIRAPRGGAHRVKLPGVLSPVQARALMAAAHEHSGGIMLGWFALCLFGGLRPYAEARHRLWPEINFTTGEISALGRKRGARVRIFKAQPLLLKWLKVAKYDGARSPGYFRERDRKRVIARANELLAAQGLPAIQWDGDMMRHTYASHRAPFISVVDLAKEMGTSTTMIYAHYMHPRPLAEAEEFWGIEPNSDAVVSA